MLLANKQKAAALVKQIALSGKPPTPQEITEISNLDPDRGKTMLENQSAQLQQKTAQREDLNTLISQAQALTAANLPVPKWLTDAISHQPTNPPSMMNSSQAPQTVQAPGSKAENNGNMHVINGVRMTDEVYDLYKNGIPVISNMRTQADQDAIPRNPNNPNLTTEGHTISTKVGAHGIGQAFDVGNLTDEQKQTLISKGWVQSTDPNDLNHWEKRGKEAPSKNMEEPVIASKPETPKNDTGYYPHTVKRAVTQGMGEADRVQTLAANTQSIKDVEEPIAKKYANQAPLFAGNSPEYTHVKSSYNNTIGMIEDHSDIAQKVFSLVRQGGPLEAALNSGIGINTGSLVANIHLPVKEMKEAGLKPYEQAYADKLFSSLIEIAMGQMKESGLNMNNIPQGEFMKTLSQYVTPETSALTALAKLNEERAKFDHRKEYFDTITNERKSRVDPNSPTPFSDVLHNSDELKKIDRKYQAILRTISKNFSDRIMQEKNNSSDKKGE